MVNINSGNQGQLESLDSLRANTNNSNGLQPLSSIKNTTYNTGLQSLDSIKANNYSDPNLSIPANDILAPIDAMNPEFPESNKVDTQESTGTAGFVAGVFKGFGKAGLDTAKGAVTLGKFAVGGLIHPSKIVNAVGGSIKYAVNNPIKATKFVAFDLPIGIVKGIIQPYGDAIHQGKYGEAMGRGVFDVGLILLTAGLGNDGDAASKTGSTVEAVDKSRKSAEVVEAVDGTSEGTKIVTTGVTGGINIEKDAIKITGDVKGNVIINIGNTTAKVTTTAGKVSTAAKTVSGTTEAITAATQGTATAGSIALGLGDLGKTLGKGAAKIAELFKPIGQEIGTGLTSLVGENAAAAIKEGVTNVGKVIGVTGYVVKKGAIFVKTYPIPSALIGGKAVDILDKGLKASDNYTPDNDNK